MDYSSYLAGEEYLYEYSWSSAEGQTYDYEETVLEITGRTWIIYLVVCGILALLISGGNLIVIVVLSKNKKLRNPQAIFKISIAISDLITGVLILPYHVVFWTVPVSSSFPLIIHKIAGSVAALSLWISLTNLTISGFDRLFAVLYPLKYKRYLGDVKRGAVVIVSVLWALFCIVAVCSTIYPQHFSVYQGLQIYGAQHTCSGACLGVIGGLTLLVWVNNIVLFIVVRRQARIMKNQYNVDTRRLKTEINLAKTLFIMSTAFTLSFLTHIVAMILSSNKLLKELKYLMLLDVADLITFSNSLWNCVIYSFRNKDFRDAVRDTILPKLRCRSLAPRSTGDSRQPVARV